MGPDPNQNLIIRVLLFIFVAMFVANTIAQFMQISYKEPFYLATWLLPLLGVVVYAYYKNRTNIKPTLLVVEDQDFWRKIIWFNLHNTYDIIFCKSGEEAIQYLQRCRTYEVPTKAIIDKNLPGGIDGITLINRIAEMGYSDIDIRILSVESPSTDREKEFVDCWLLKVPEVFGTSNGLKEALRDKPLDNLREAIIKLISKIVPVKIVCKKRDLKSIDVQDPPRRD